MTTINVCVTVFRRYDLLRQLLLSLEKSIVPIDQVWIVNNGQSEEKLAKALESVTLRIHVNTPSAPMGLAWAVNYFIDNVPEERIITNDDIIFAPESIGALTAPTTDVVWADGIGWSCFLLRDNCIKNVGKWDEAISPAYTYFDDMDYAQRMKLSGNVTTVTVPTGMIHVGSATLRDVTAKEQEEHHRKFLLARSNYLRKWNLSDSDL